MLINSECVFASANTSSYIEHDVLLPTEHDITKFILMRRQVHNIMLSDWTVKLCIRLWLVAE